MVLHAMQSQTIFDGGLKMQCNAILMIQLKFGSMT